MRGIKIRARRESGAEPEDLDRAARGTKAIPLGAAVDAARGVASGKEAAASVVAAAAAAGIRGRKALP